MLSPEVVLMHAISGFVRYGCAIGSATDTRLIVDSMSNTAAGSQKLGSTELNLGHIVVFK